MRSFWLLLVLLPAVLGAQAQGMIGSAVWQEPVQDVAIAPAAITTLRESWKSVNALYACLIGHTEGAVIVIDSADVEITPAPDDVVCPGKYIGAAGFYRGYVGGEEEAHGLMESTMVLNKRPEWLIAGIVHGVAPTFTADGTRIIAPLMWRATRAPKQQK